MGAGTERIAAAARRITPSVWRFDRDVITPGQDVTTRLAPFRNHRGVLVATSLVLPWLEWLRPDLVAVVAADRLLHRPEFRATERVLALLRTVGMATRTRVLVETADPVHPAIRAVETSSLRSFYAAELEFRRTLGYPPYRSLVHITITARGAASADLVTAHLAAARSPSLEVLGPSPVSPRRPGGRIGQEIVVKASDRGAIREIIWPIATGTGLPRDVRITVDVDPHDL